MGKIKWFLKGLKENKTIKKCPEPESNQRLEDFQSSALPTELTGHLQKNTTGGILP